MRIILHAWTLMIVVGFPVLAYLTYLNVVALSELMGHL